MNTLKSILKPVSSLYLTVFLLLSAMLLIFAGTLAQRQHGIWQVQAQYFHSWWTWVEFQNLLPFVKAVVPGKFPFIGGYTLIILMLVNLLAAHSIRFKPKWMDLVFLPLLGAAFGLAGLWQFTSGALAGGLCIVGSALATVLFLVALGFLHKKRSGVILIHLGLIMLLAGEIVTSRMASESQMRIDEGQSLQYSYDIREPELAVVDPSASDHDNVTIVTEKRLLKGGVIKDAKLPFDLKLVRYYSNSTILGPMQIGDGEALATGGTINGMPANKIKLAAKPRVTGTQGQDVDAAGAFVTAVAKDGRELGTSLLWLYNMDPQPVEVDGKMYEVSLRFKRIYKPYAVSLIKFSHDKYLGTGTPSNFSALVRLVDPTRNEDRQVLIKMNSPLRYGGETFYQSGFNPDVPTQTTLQVVRNPGWMVPYVAIIVGAVGMAVHFLIHLVGFLRRRQKESAARELAAAGGIPFAKAAGAPKAGGPGSRPPPNKKNQGGANGGRRPTEVSAYTLAPTRGPASAAFIVPAVLGLIVFGVAVVKALPSRVSEKWDFNRFGELPVNYEGRVMPLDALARNSLKVLSGRESTSETRWKDDADGTEVATLAEAAAAAARGRKMTAVKKSVPAIEWLAEAFGATERGSNLEVFRVDNDDVREAIGLADERDLPDGSKEKRKYYSPAELEAVGPKLAGQLKRVEGVPDDQQSTFQKQLIHLGQHYNLYNRLTTLGTLYVVPPVQQGQEWRTLSEVVRAGQSQAAQDPQAAVRRDPTAAGFVGIIEAYRKDQPAEFRAAVGEYQRMLDGSNNAALDKAAGKASFETFFNRFDPFTLSSVCYVIAFILVAVSWLLATNTTGGPGGWGRPVARGAAAIVAVSLLVHTFGILARMYISGRPPVTNLYSSAVFIGWGAVALGLGLERIYRNTIGLTLATVAGFLSLLVAAGFAATDAAKGEGDTMAQLQAVLDTNFWLATHVVCISIGYLATFAAGLLGIVYVVGGVFTTSLSDGGVRKDMGRMVYGTVCFAMFFSFVGTILGGIWADQSWGRFWGWDPKENGAILIVLWNAAILHARWCGLIKVRGLMLWAIVGNIVTAWSWVGTNMLGVGLHSYGFMGAAWFWLIMFCISQVMLVAVGNLPLAAWKSFAEESEGAAA